MSSIHDWRYEQATSIYHGPNGETVKFKWQTDPNLPIDPETRTITNLKTGEVMSIDKFCCSGQTRILYVLGPFDITPEQEDQIYRNSSKFPWKENYIIRQEK
jgi:hypothetical protein